MQSVWSLIEMNDETAELLRQIKAYRNDMVARNYPHQEISDIITKWETRDTSNDPFKGTSIEGKD